jgi:hypothetical protein
MAGGLTPDYGMTSRSIFRLADMLRQGTNDKYRHDEAMPVLDLQSAKDDADRQTLAGQHRIALEQQKRQKFLAEPVDIQTAITESKLSPDTKQKLLQGLPKELLGTVAPRAKIFEAYGKAKQNMLNRRSNEKINAQRAATSKDNRSTMEKDVDAISRIYRIDRKQAYERYQKDKNLGERIRLYNNAVENLDKFLNEDEKEQKLKHLQQAFGIDELMNKPQEQQVQTPQKPTVNLVWDSKQMKLVPAK